MKLTLRPRMPPFSLISFTHRRTPSRADWPSRATGPLSGVHIPMRISVSPSSAWARAGPPTIADATAASTMMASLDGTSLMAGSFAAQVRPNLMSVVLSDLNDAALQDWPLRLDKVPKPGVGGDALAALLRFEEGALFIDAQDDLVLHEDAAVAQDRVGTSP